MPFTRRQFMKTSGAAAAAFALSAPAAQQERQTVRRPIKKAVKLGMVAGEMSLLEKFRLLKELGFDGVEPDSPNNLDPDEVLAARKPVLRWSTGQT